LLHQQWIFIFKTESKAFHTVEAVNTARETAATPSAREAI
jgi:hypothetical protein